jgi:hypothetical protein
MKAIKIVTSLALLASSTACANLSPLTSSKRISDAGSYWLTYEASRRGALLSTDGTKIIRSCAEPAPDAAYSFANSLKGKFSLGGASAEGVDAALNATIVALSGRDNLVLLARESLFRLCEARTNGDISPDQYAASFVQVLTSIKEIAEAEKANSQAVTGLTQALSTKK